MEEFERKKEAVLKLMVSDELARLKAKHDAEVVACQEKYKVGVALAETSRKNMMDAAQSEFNTAKVKADANYDMLMNKAKVERDDAMARIEQLAASEVAEAPRLMKEKLEAVPSLVNTYEVYR